MVTGNLKALGLRVTYPKGVKCAASGSATAKEIIVEVVAPDGRYYEFTVDWIQDEKTNKGSFAVSGRNTS